MKKIILPLVDVPQTVYQTVFKAFEANGAELSIAATRDKYPDQFYFTEMADFCLTDAKALTEYIECYTKVCDTLAKSDETTCEFVEFVKMSFFIFAVREIHTREQEAKFQSALTELELEIDKNRDSFDENVYASRFEKRWCERYVNIGANFNFTFLFPVTLRCNKKCKYCMVFSPYLTVLGKNYHPTFEELCKNIDSAFSIVDTSYGIQIAGGEPCIRDDLPDFIDYIGDHYKDRISKFTRSGTGFGIITNSSIDFSDRLIEASKRFGSKLCWLIDDYHFSIADKIIDKLEKNGIKYTYRDYKTKEIMHCDGWINPFNDYSNPTDSLAAVTAAKRCGQKQLIFQCVVANGKIYHCSRVMAADFYWPGMERTREDSVDMFDTNTTKEEKADKIKKLLCSNYFHTCDKCKGLCDGRKRLYPATQLTADELKSLREGRIAMTDFGNYDE